MSYKFFVGGVASIPKNLERWGDKTAREKSTQASGRAGKDASAKNAGGAKKVGRNRENKKGNREMLLYLYIFII